MQDHFPITCPYCGGAVEIYLEPDIEGSLVQDCEVCCNPWQLQVWFDGENRRVAVTRADGSE
ncbi:MAG: CPXCG motif-containing cysteine-rich protein [Gammaproteobacteria bacterium]